MHIYSTLCQQVKGQGEAGRQRKNPRLHYPVLVMCVFQLIAVGEMDV
jgi:hypothetical protein